MYEMRTKCGKIKTREEGFFFAGLNEFEHTLIIISSQWEQHKAKKQLRGKINLKVCLMAPGLLQSILNR